MADDITLNAGSGGDELAADDITQAAQDVTQNSKTEVVKIATGASGFATFMTAAAGAVAAGTPRVTLASDDPGVALLGTIDADTSEVAATVHVDDAVFGVATDKGILLLGANTSDTIGVGDKGAIAIDTARRILTSAIIGQVGVAGGEGTISSATQRVTIATDDDGVAHLATIAGDTTSVDGKITACDTGAVVVATSALPAGAATAAAQLADGHNVTVDNAAGAAAVNVQDGGNSITVDGTVTANLSATDNAVLDQIELNTSYGDSVGGGTEAAALRVTIANNSTGVLTVDGTVTANAGSGTLSVDLGANNDVTATGSVANDAADSGNPVKIGAHATNSVEGETQVANSDRVDLKADLNGVMLTRNGTTLEELISGSQSNTDGSEDAMTAFAAGGAGVHNYITSVTIHNAHATTSGFVELVDGTGGTTMWVFPAPATGGATHNFDPPLKQATANTGLFFDPSAAITTIYVSINGFQAQG